MKASNPNTFHDKEFQKITEFLPYIDKSDLAVSKANVGWHLSHSVLVMESILNVIEKSDPEDYKPKFNLLRSVFMTLGAFPRGRAKAPKAVRPSDDITKESIEQQIAQVQKRLINYDNLHPKANFTHPVFGTCNKEQTKKFIKMHTNHHLKIVRDILK